MDFLSRLIPSLLRFLDPLLEKLGTNKTMITGIVMIVYGILQEPKNVEMIMAGLGFIFAREAISKLAPPKTDDE